MYSRCLHNMVNFSPLPAEIGSGVWSTPANFNGFRVLAALLHGRAAITLSIGPHTSCNLTAAEHNGSLPTPGHMVSRFETVPRYRCV